MSSFIHLWNEQINQLTLFHIIHVTVRIFLVLDLLYAWTWMTIWKGPQCGNCRGFGNGSVVSNWSDWPREKPRTEPLEIPNVFLYFSVIHLLTIDIMIWYIYIYMWYYTSDQWYQHWPTDKQNWQTTDWISIDWISHSNSSCQLVTVTVTWLDWPQIYIYSQLYLDLDLDFHSSFVIVMSLIVHCWFRFWFLILINYWFTNILHLQ